MGKLPFLTDPQMLRVKPLTYLMVLAVLTAHAHCMAAHGESIRQEVGSPHGEPAPADDPPSCENESACICKGAVHSSVDLHLLGDDFVCFLAIDAATASCLDVTAAKAVSLPPATSPPPLDGDTMRAQLQVLQL